MAIDVKTAAEFKIFEDRSVRGERARYHIGYLARDVKGPTDGVRLRDLLRVVRRASNGGYVVLTQRRVSEDLYEYFATRC